MPNDEVRCIVWPCPFRVTLVPQTDTLRYNSPFCVESVVIPPSDWLFRLYYTQSDLCNIDADAAQ